LDQFYKGIIPGCKNVKTNKQEKENIKGTPLWIKVDFYSAIIILRF